MKIAIVGAGPAGLICAWQLTRWGHDISLFESKTTLQAQGSGVLIQPIGLAVLELLGLRSEAELLGHKISRITGFSFPSNRRTVNVDYQVLSGTNYALGMNRTALWMLLHKKVVETGVIVQTGISISKLRYTSSGRVILIDENEDIEIQQHFDLVIDASGANSSLRQFAHTPVSGTVLQYGSLWCKVKLDHDSPYHTDAMVLHTDQKNVGVGLMPIGRATPASPELITMFFNLDWLDYPDWNDESFSQWKNNIALQWPDTQPFLEQLQHYDQLYLAKFMQHTLPRPYGNRLAFIGDSAHASSPQLGQGINMSLIDAVSLSWALEQENNLELALKLYARKRKVHVMIYQTLARMLTPFYQSDNQAAVALRDAFYPVLFRLFLMKSATAYLISGRAGRPLKHLAR